MLSNFSIFEGYINGLVGVKTRQASLLNFTIREQDNQSGIDLKLAKNFLKVDGESEDDVILMLIESAKKAIEEKHGISLDGKIVEANVLLDGYFDETILPYYSQVCTVTNCNHNGTYAILTYEVQANKDPRYLQEVYTFLLSSYENKTHSKRAKKIHI